MQVRVKQKTELSEWSLLHGSYVWSWLGSRPGLGIQVQILIKSNVCVCVCLCVSLGVGSELQSDRKSLKKAGACQVLSRAEILRNNLVIFLLSNCSFHVCSRRPGSFWFYWRPFTHPQELLPINLSVAKITSRLKTVLSFLFNFLCIFLRCSITVIHI